MVGLGQPLSSFGIEQGLRELCSDIHFDMPNKIGDAYFLLATPDREQINQQRYGVYYNGRYICALDRGVVPEYKIWDEVEGWREIGAGDVDRHEIVHTLFFQILPSDPGYHEALYRAERKDDRYSLDAAGKVFKWQHLVQTKVRGSIVSIGWRHTFENLIAANIPGVTRRSLAEKFGVDLSKDPEGPREDVLAALVEE